MQKRLKEIKPGEIFTYAGYEWIKLEDDLSIMKDILEERAFDEKSNDWRESEIRTYLNNDFLEILEENGMNLGDLYMIATDLTADDGLEDYKTSLDHVSLLTADLYRTNRHLLEPIDSRWWLSTPRSCLDSYNSRVLIVYRFGILSNIDNINTYCGVRPVIKLYSAALVSVRGEDEETDIIELIKQWAVDRGLDKVEPKAQMVKLMEEVGELANGINKNNKELIIDSIGDVYVVLTILSMQLGLDIKDCIKSAYEEIKDRKGKMINGTFVKEEDL